MAGEVTTNPKRYVCPKHGNVTNQLMWITIWGDTEGQLPPLKTIGIFCMYCYSEFLTENIGQVQEQKKDSKAKKCQGRLIGKPGRQMRPAAQRPSKGETWPTIHQPAD